MGLAVVTCVDDYSTLEIKKGSFRIGTLATVEGTDEFEDGFLPDLQGLSNERVGMGLPLDQEVDGMMG